MTRQLYLNKVIVLLICYVSLLFSSVATDITLTWDSNPSYEKVKEYVVLVEKYTSDGDRVVYNKTLPRIKVPATKNTCVVSNLVSGIYRFKIYA